jgi:hypothetical protein
MAVEICPIRPINLGGQLEHLEGNIVSRRRNIVEYGRKQSFPISGIDAGAVAGHVLFRPSKVAAARFRGRFDHRPAHGPLAPGRRGASSGASRGQVAHRCSQTQGRHSK